MAFIDELFLVAFKYFVLHSSEHISNDPHTENFKASCS